MGKSQEADRSEQVRYSWRVFPGRLFTRDEAGVDEPAVVVNHTDGIVLIHGNVATHLLGYAVGLAMRSLPPGTPEPRLLLPCWYRRLPAGWRWFNGYLVRAWPAA